MNYLFIKLVVFYMKLDQCNTERTTTQLILAVQSLYFQTKQACVPRLDAASKTAPTPRPKLYLIQLRIESIIYRVHQD
jgi:hypothetical protein